MRQSLFCRSLEKSRAATFWAIGRMGQRKFDFSLLLPLSFSPFCTYEPTSQIHPKEKTSMMEKSLQSTQKSSSLHKGGPSPFIRGKPVLSAHRVKSRFSVKSRNPNPSPTGKIKFGFLSLGRSGETRTRGLLLPKQARYQLRNTPAAEYSIPRLGRFVNRELPPGRRRGRPYPNSVSRVDSTPSSSLEGQTARAACFTSAGAFA